MTSLIIKRFGFPLILLLLILLTGTGGYWFISGGKHSIVDCLYMTVITILTIGFTEVIQLDDAGKLFTIVIAFTGIGTATYIISTFTAMIVEGHLKETFKRRKMEKQVKKLENHFIICGAGRVGSVIINELYETGRDFIVIERNEETIGYLSGKYPGILVVEGDADHEGTLEKAGIRTAEGIFASTGDDNQNLVISLTAKYINPNIRVVARCLESVNENKMRKAGADSVITENFIAGMRMASEMIRPTVVSFLDKMLGDKDKNLRVEEIRVHEKHAGKKITELEMEKFPNTLILAIAAGETWIYSPKGEQKLVPGSRIVVITTPEERLKLTGHLQE
ncbi:MAG TPA: potassium channel protein [Ignavibacteria bacterium]|jgi:voltage-gated potassium channel